MLGVGSSIWNRALAGKGAGDGGNPPAEATPIHSLDLTTAPSASNAFDDYGLALPRTVTDYNGRIVEIPADAVPMGGLRPVRNLWPTADGSDTPSTQVITVTSGRVYQLRIGAESASGATAVCSGAFTGTLTGDGADIQAFDTGKTATTTSLTVTITGSVRKIQLQDITHRADLSTAPDEFVSTDDDYGTGVNGFRYFDTELANTVASNVVTEGTGASIDGWLDYQPAATNILLHSNDLTQWTQRGTISITKNGRYSEVRGVDFAGFADCFITSSGFAADAACSLYFYMRAVSTSGVVNVIQFYNSANGLWRVDLSQLSTTDFEYITADHPAVTVVNSYKTDSSGRFGLFIYKQSGTGGLDFDISHIQSEIGDFPTAYIPTTTGSATRPAMSPAPTISGLVGTEDARLTVKGLAADLVTPDPTDTTERTLDVDNTDGEFDTLPSPIKVLSIDVYNDGERPA